MISKFTNMFTKTISMPKKSVLQFVGVVASAFVMLTWLDPRPLGLFFLATLAFWVYKTRCNLRIVPPPELENKYEQFVNRLIYWRRNRPTMLSVTVAAVLAVTAFIGHFLSGSTLVLALLALAGLISTKYNFRLNRIEPSDLSWFWFGGEYTQEAEADDEFMPEVNECNLVVLERASELTLPTASIDDEENSDEIPSDLLIPDVIPEVNENSTDEDDDLVPNVQRAEQIKLINHKEDPCYGDSNKSRELLEFRKGHFKYDSSLSTSSSSEESLSKGLQFPDYTAVDGSTPRQKTPLEAGDINIASLSNNAKIESVFTSGSKLLPNLMAGIAQWGSTMGNVATQPIDSSRRFVPSFDSSDESDYEILEEHDFK